MRPNNAVKDALIAWAHGAGCSWYLLGGDSAVDDGIFRYKRTFAPKGVIDFEIGRQIYDAPAYDEVVSQWQAASTRSDEQPQRLQCYWE